ncbi:hypothetical protein AGMMS50239_38940 [Bacteroidia bacterium]|nr:hypothetical protein AGMMS50239_38940 [Bacteroidia bacterium]
MRKDMKITKEQTLKAIKKAQRDVELEFRPGFISHDRPHKNKKKYDRKRMKSHPQKGWDFFLPDCHGIGHVWAKKIGLSSRTTLSQIINKK